MSLTLPQKQIHNILQETIIRIPYFLSPSTSTTTISVQVQNSTIERNIQESLLNPQQLQKHHIIGYQWKLYYDKESNCFKSIIILFENVQYAQKFYFSFANNVDKTYGAAKTQSEPTPTKYPIYFCRDITETGINMSNILYTSNKTVIQAPECPFLRQTIKQISKLIVVQGIRAQTQLQNLKTKILPSSLCELLSFLDPKYLSSESNYYRWRVYSYLQGDGENNYNLHKFRITENGAIYTPPQMESYGDKQHNNILSHLQRGYITKLLENVNCNKYHIEEAMTFFVSKSMAAGQLAAILAVEAVAACGRIGKEEDVKGKNWKHLVALFYLISDILFNSPTTIYRDIFTTLLPALISRIPQSPQIVTKLSQLIQIFDKKFIFEQEFLQGLKHLLNHNLPSMKPLGMQQMTKSQHQSYQQLLKLDTVEQIQQLCWKHGIVFQENKIQECVRNLAFVLSGNRDQNAGHDGEDEPEPGDYDGELLTEKEIMMIRKKQCKVISLEDVNVKFLFQKDKNSKSVNFQRQ